MARDLQRKLIDAKGHQWCVAVPADFNADSTEDLVLAAHEGLAKLLGYKLDGDVWRLPDNTEMPQGNKQFSFFKKQEVAGVAQEDFAEAMQKLIDKARRSKLGSVKVTEWEGKHIEQDSRGYFIKWSVPCHICNKDIDGTKRLSQSSGVFTRSQMFQSFDKGVVQYRPGSKLRVCGECAPKSVTPAEAGLPFPTVDEVVEQEKVELQIQAVAAQEERTKAKAQVKKDVLDELLDFAKPGSDIDAQFFRGMAYGILKTLKAKGD